MPYAFTNQFQEDVRPCRLQQIADGLWPDELDWTWEYPGFSEKRTIILSGFAKLVQVGESTRWTRWTLTDRGREFLATVEQDKGW